ncbi:MAG: T9SS type A sorting domain-containing protein [Elusimicrobia bacterium]|nr:T9SS type A sorting domain-containing protein [Elusimicrobiota bacterium]
MSRAWTRVAAALCALAALPGASGAQLLQSPDLKQTVPYHVFDTLGGENLGGGGFQLQSAMGQLTSVGLAGGGYLLGSGIFEVRPSARLNLDALHAFPTPFRPSRGDDRITFRGTTTNTRIRIYTLTGWNVITLQKNDSTTQDLVWLPVQNSAGQPLASGVYIYVADDESGSKTGKFMVIK